MELTPARALLTLLRGDFMLSMEPVVVEDKVENIEIVVISYNGRTSKTLPAIASDEELVQSSMEVIEQHAKDCGYG